MHRASGLVCLIALLSSHGCAEPKLPAKTSAAAVANVEAEQSLQQATNDVQGKAEPPKDPVLEAPTPDGHNWLSQEEISDGWIRLFDGQTLFGWKSNSALTWKVQNGVITADSANPEHKGLLVSTTRFANYELRCDARVQNGGNSGIFLRTVFQPTDAAVDCYELNICDTHPAFQTASLVKRQNPEQPVHGDGEWHTYAVRLDGPRIVVKFDGQQVLDYTDTTEKPLQTGSIGLQMNGGAIEFRNIYLKPLGMTDLFNGQTLDGWHEVPGSKSQFKVRDGAIHVTNGRGFLESDVTAGQFVFQFQAITNGEKLNSGVFFRAMPGTVEAPSNGYEFQIQNGFKQGDRTKPDDHGTGAIFRRVSVRRIVSNDREWFTGTLVADGPHLSTWVNGVQVVDWTDERPRNDNPRDGLRTAAGHFSLQGHDPTTDLAFRNLRLVETPDEPL